MASLFGRNVVVGAKACVLRVPSNRQINRKLRHPARLRAMQRQQAEKPLVPLEEIRSQLLESLKYKPTYVPEQVSFNGWSPAPESPIEGLPFKVKRTATGLQLPVYRDYRNGNTRVLTILRRYVGDEQELQNELSKVCGGQIVHVRPGRMEVAGDHAAEVKKWLTGLGF